MARRVRVIFVGDIAAWSRSRADLEAAGLEVEATVSAASAFEGHAPDVVVLADGRPLERVAAEWDDTAHRAPAVVLLTQDEDRARELAALGLRGWAIVPPDVAGPDLAAAILAAGRGFAVRPASSLDDEAGEERPEIVEALTARERDVLNLVAEGLPNKAIAARLGISEHTVKFHVASIFGKLGVSTRTEAVRAGVRAGLITL